MAEMMTIDTISAAEEAYAKYTAALNEFQAWAAGNPEKLMLFQVIERLIERKRSGDLRDVDFIPVEQEIKARLNLRKYNRVDAFFRHIEKYGTEFAGIIRHPVFLEQLNLLASVSRMEKKAKYLKALLISQAGTDYLHECALYDEGTDPRNSPLYSFAAIEADLNEAEQTIGTADFVDFSVQLAETLEYLIPEFVKYKQITVTRLYFVIARFSTIYYEEVRFLPQRGGGLPAAHRSLTGPERTALVVEVRLLLTTEREIRIKNVLRDVTDLLVAELNYIYACFQIADSIQTLVENPNLRHSVEFIGNFIGITQAVFEKYALYLDEAGRTAFRNGSAYKAVSFLANEVNNYALGPVQFCFALDEVMQNTLDGDRRAAWTSTWFAFSGISGTFIAIIGITAGWGLVIALALVLGGLMTGFLMPSKEEEDLAKWLDRNYFGKRYSLDYPDRSRPVDVGFEWASAKATQEEREAEIALRQICALHSLLQPLNLSPEAGELIENRYHLTIQMDKPAIAPADFYLRIRFFDETGRETTDTRIDKRVPVAAGDLNWYLIPVSIFAPDNVPAGWKDNPENWWFVTHELKLDTQDTQQSILRGIESYSVTIRLNRDESLRHRYYQVQVIPRTGEGMFNGRLNKTNLPAYVNAHPFVVKSTKSIHL